MHNYSVALGRNSRWWTFVADVNYVRWGMVDGVCVFFTLNRSFYPSTSSTTSVRADSSILEEIQVLWSQSYATEILR